MTDTPDRAFAIQIGDHVEMRKPHACGGSTWMVYRVGADIGLRCLTCGRLTMLTRTTFRKRLKRIVQTVDR